MPSYPTKNLRTDGYLPNGLESGFRQLLRLLIWATFYAAKNALYTPAVVESMNTYTKTITCIRNVSAYLRTGILMGGVFLYGIRTLIKNILPFSKWQSCCSKGSHYINYCKVKYNNKGQKLQRVEKQTLDEFQIS